MRMRFSPMTMRTEERLDTKKRPKNCNPMTVGLTTNICSRALEWLLGRTRNGARATTTQISTTIGHKTMRKMILMRSEHRDGHIGIMNVLITKNAMMGDIVDMAKVWKRNSYLRHLEPYMYRQMFAHANNVMLIQELPFKKSLAGQSYATEAQVQI